MLCKQKLFDNDGGDGHDADDIKSLLSRMGPRPQRDSPRYTHPVSTKRAYSGGSGTLLETRVSPSATGYACAQTCPPFIYLLQVLE